jgi:hypothetical protein
MMRTIRALQLAQQRPDTAEDIRQRLIRRAAAERGMADREERFPNLTPFNADAAIRYQEERIAYHEKRMGARRPPLEDSTTGPMSTTAPGASAAAEAGKGNSAGSATDGHESALRGSSL